MDNSDITVIKPRPGKRANAPQQSVTPPSDQTIIKPRPRPGGKRTPPTAAMGDTTVIKPRHPSQSATVDLKFAAIENTHATTIAEAAAPVLALATQLKQIQGKVDGQRLRNYVQESIKQFDSKITKLESDIQIRQDANYILCALIDETILNTTWGEMSGWSQHPILSIFHKETYGGEKFYRILDKSLESPYEHKDLLEILFVAMSLGFMGKLRIDPQGPIKIEKIRSRLYDVLHRSREKYNNTLSVNISPQVSSKQHLYSFLPAWLLIGTLVLAAFGLYSYWLIGLNKESDATRVLMANLIPTPEKKVLDPSMVRPEFIELRALLTPEIDRGILSVEDYPTHTSIVLHNQELFTSGNINITPSFEPILDKIAKALEAIPGRIIVSGHTDNESIRTPRYPSNWHLSLARASEVVKYLAASADLKSRLLPEGRGANEPIMSNDTAAGRAHNRRVVIDVYYHQGLIASEQQAK
ncbi:type VI secretion system protein TssL, long form [Saccharophagus degradans]|uniref:type VI secretion system protein TssL, long form n=1 Tax=Saccharophagus degradans TaxID=86304 RepID=UPI001C08A071|nr:type VI secretion system protein TssL, long form [Saccharophagus degradans]MBU2987225.1 type VI secretion system protein TssL, long form [Saccharophagus degradans]